MSLPGPLEIIVILIVVLVIFGPKRIPEIGKALGRGMKEFKKAMRSFSGDDEQEKSDQNETDKD